jgi:hypothetical protein
MNKARCLIVVLLFLCSLAFAAVIYPMENFDQNTYHYCTAYNDGILPEWIVGGLTGPHGYYTPTQHFSMGDWVPDPSSGLWYNIMGDAAGDQGTTTPFMLTDQAIKSIYMPPDYTTLFTYPYALTNPANPYYYYKLDQVNFSTGYWANFWNSPNTSWYCGDVNGGYLITNGMVDLTLTAYLTFSVLKLPGGGGSGYLYVDYSTTSAKEGPWTNLIDGHQIQHSSGTWVSYTEELPPVTLPDGTHNVYLRVRFRGNVTTGWANAPFEPQPNYWMDDFVITDEPPVPIELSSFTAALSVDNFVNLTWVTQSETGVQGFYILRNTTDDLSSALTVSNMISATNTSSQQTYVFKDTELYEEGTYYYWLQNADIDGSSEFYGPVTINYAIGGGGIPSIPLTTELRSVYPNPFNPSAHIPYTIAENRSVRFEIYNARGQLIRTIDAGIKTPGNYQIEWDGTDNHGITCNTGVYYIHMLADKDSFLRKAVLIK